MKAGLIQQHLEVIVEMEDLSHISQIEFLFRQVRNMNGEVFKKSLYGTNGDVTLVNGVFLVPFSKADTYKFKQDAPFYMDTRITLDNSVDNPETEIVPLVMNATLFRSDD